MFRFSGLEQRLRAANRFFERFMPVLTPTGVVLGLFLAHTFMPLKPLVTYLFAFVTLVNGLGVSVRDFAAVTRKPRPVFAFLVNAYLLVPVVVSVLAKLLFHGNDDAILGYILLYSIPTAVVGSVWSGIYNGNAALSLTLLVIGTLLAPLSTPLTVKVLAASDIKIDTTGMMLSLLYMVVIPSVIGIAINTFSKGKCNEHVSPCLKPFTKIALIFVIMINTSQIADDLIARMTVAFIPQFLATFFFVVLGFLISYGTSKLLRFTRDDTISITFASGMKNISVAMVIAIDFFPPLAVIPVISGIVLQQTTCALTAHFLFGERPENRKESKENRNEDNS